jgi:hypothetical protein
MGLVKKIIQLLLVFSLAMLYISCSSSLSGPLFKPVTEIPTDRSILYLYRPDTDNNTEFTISYNNIEVCILVGGGYFPFYAEPGKVKISSAVNFKMFATGLLDQAASGTRDFFFQAEQGKIYYLECKGHQELFIKVVPEKYGLSSIKDCRLLEPISP